MIKYSITEEEKRILGDKETVNSSIYFYLTAQVFWRRDVK